VRTQGRNELPNGEPGRIPLEGQRVRRSSNKSRRWSDTLLLALWVISYSLLLNLFELLQRFESHPSGHGTMKPGEKNSNETK
jgi:hypothetical protein